MAQSVEHHLGKVEVPGSNPGNSSKIQIPPQGGISVMAHVGPPLGKDVPSSNPGFFILHIIRLNGGD